MYSITKKVDNILNADLRQSLRANYWATLPIHKDEISKVPTEIILELHNREKELEEVKKKTDYQASAQFLSMFKKNWPKRAHSFVLFV